MNACSVEASSKCIPITWLAIIGVSVLLFVGRASKWKSTLTFRNFNFFIPAPLSIYFNKICYEQQLFLFLSVLYKIFLKIFALWF